MRCRRGGWTRRASSPIPSPRAFPNRGGSISTAPFRENCCSGISMTARLFPPRPPGQRGSALAVVIALGAVLLLLGATTLLSARNSGRVAGIQRLDFQDIHAAEAGLVRTRQRL